MNFGSKNNFEYILANIGSPDNEYMYEHLYEVLRKDVFDMTELKKVPESDREAVFEKVASKVFFKLTDFVMSSAEMSEGQRNSWLKTIVKSKVADYFRREYKKHEMSMLEEIVENGETHLKYASNDNIESMLNNQALTNQLLTSISDVCELNTTPDKIIAFFLNCYTCVSGTYRANGRPQQICDEFNGKDIYYVASVMKKRIQESVCVRIPNEVYASLDKKLADTGKREIGAIFDLNAKKISDSTKWIRSKLEEKRSEQVGEPY